MFRLASFSLLRQSHDAPIRKCVFRNTSGDCTINGRHTWAGRDFRSEMYDKLVAVFKSWVGIIDWWTIRRVEQPRIYWHLIDPNYFSHYPSGSLLTGDSGLGEASNPFVKRCRANKVIRIVDGAFGRLFNKRHTRYGTRCLSIYICICRQAVSWPRLAVTFM